MHWRAAVPNPRPSGVRSSKVVHIAASLSKDDSAVSWSPTAVRVCHTFPSANERKNASGPNVTRARQMPCLEFLLSHQPPFLRLRSAWLLTTLAHCLSMPFSSRVMLVAHDRCHQVVTYDVSSHFSENVFELAYARQQRFCINLSRFIPYCQASLFLCRLQPSLMRSKLAQDKPVSRILLDVCGAVKTCNARTLVRIRAFLPEVVRCFDS